MEPETKRTRKVQNQVLSQWTWKNVKSCIIGQSSTHVREKVAGFDMDCTLVNTKSGAKFAKNAEDWVYWDQSVPTKLKELYDDGYKIVIFTNQKGISTGNCKAEHIKKKIQDIAKDIDIEMQAVIATKDDQFRKPNVQMWTLFLQHNEGKVDKAKSFYCGDAAGRKDGKHKDFSDSDLKFALNVGVQFKTPENLFHGDENKVQVKGFNPATIVQKAGNLFANSPDQDVKFVQKQMVIFTGCPGAGKSTFWKNYMPKYERINRDTLKTKQKCYKVAEQFIKNGKSVVIDNTNPKKQDRKYFIDLAKKHNYKIRSFFFLTPKQLCTHNDGQRATNQARQHFSKKVGRIAIATYWKYVQKPTTAQGFYQVKEVNFLTKFDSEADKEAYQKFGKSQR